MHTDTDLTHELMRYIETLGYRSFIVRETCGSMKDCRNIINLPVEAAAEGARALKGLAHPIDRVTILEHGRGWEGVTKH